MSVRALAIALLLGYVSLAAAAEKKITIEKQGDGAVIKVDGELFTEYIAFSGAKPVLWPVIGPSGKAMTRQYPMKEEKLGLFKGARARLRMYRQMLPYMVRRRVRGRRKSI